MIDPEEIHVAKKDDREDWLVIIGLFLLIFGTLIVFFEIL